MVAVPVVAMAFVAGAVQADPRCAAFGRPDYSASRITRGPSGETVARVFTSGPLLRIEGPAPPPNTGRQVTIFTPEGQFVFSPQAPDRVVVRFPPPPRQAPTPDAQRVREEPQPEGVILITEFRDPQGTWLEMERALCRRDGVLLSTRRLIPLEGRLVPVETRQTDIRLGRQDPAMFRPPEGSRVIDPPPMPPRGGTAPAIR